MACNAMSALPQTGYLLANSALKACCRQLHVCTSKSESSVLQGYFQNAKELVWQWRGLDPQSECMFVKATK